MTTTPSQETARLVALNPHVYSAEATHTHHDLIPDALIRSQKLELDGSAHDVQVYSSYAVGQDAPEIVTQKSQAISTHAFLKAGHITPEMVGDSGLFTDQYSDRSQHILVENGTKNTAARYIYADSKKGWYDSLPTAQHFSLDPKVLLKTAGVATIDRLKSSEVVEISRLATVSKEGESGDIDATKILYARLLRESLEQGHKLWLMNVDLVFIKRYLPAILGDDHAQVLGKSHAYMGSPTIPIAMNPADVVRKIFKDDTERGEINREYIKSTFDGIDDKKVPKDIRKILHDNGVMTEKYSPILRALTNPKVLAYSTILGYSALRPLPAMFVEEFKGETTTGLPIDDNTAMLWTIDVATAVPYTWGALEAITGKTAKRRALGAAVAVPTFIAPYAYFYAKGEGDYPPLVNAVVAGFIGYSVLSEVRARSKQKKIQAQLAKPSDS